RRVHAGKVVTPSNVHPEVRKVLHQQTPPNDGLNRSGDCGLHCWLKGRQYEMHKLRHARTDQDEAHEKAGERDAPEKSERRQSIEDRADEGKNREERALAPTDVEQSHRGWTEPGETLLGHM